MSARLGVLVTYYNEREGLAQCLESLWRGECHPDEILVYDDASQYPAQGFVPEDIPVRVVRGDRNIGPGAARNRLLAETQAELIHFHDADDLFEPLWCQSVMDEFHRESLDAVFTEISSYEGARLVSRSVQNLVPLKDADELVRFCLKGAILTSAGTYRTATVKKVAGYRESLWQSEDFDFHIRLAAQGISFRILCEPLIRRTQVAGRSRHQLEVWSSALQAIELLSNELKGKFRPDLSEAAARISSILYNLGAKDLARRGFGLAQDLGPPTYEHHQRFYRLIAARLGPECAEWVGWVYRHAIPGRLRSAIRGSIEASADSEGMGS